MLVNWPFALHNANSPIAVLIDKIESGGGTYSPKLIDTCTHLVTTQKDVDDNKPKCEQFALFIIRFISFNCRSTSLVVYYD